MKHSEEVIKVEHLKNYLGGNWVHKDVSFTINRGEICAIVGGSGCGKTTVLRSILKLLTPTDGNIHVFDTDVLHCSQKKIEDIQHRWGVAFQHNALFSSLTVLENVMYPLQEFTNLSKDEIKKIALLKILLSGLDTSAAPKYPSELSGGMQKRAAVARAIALDPELLFLDEPTSGLDPESAEAFDNLILHLRDALGLTIIMVTHDLDSLWQSTDKVIFLGEGKALAVEPMSKLVKNPHPMIKSYFSGARAYERQHQYHQKEQ